MNRVDGGQVGAAQKNKQNRNWTSGWHTGTRVHAISAEFPPTPQDIKVELYVGSLTLEAWKKNLKHSPDNVPNLTAALP